MKPSNAASGQAYTGVVKNGVIVLDAQVILEEGQTVRVEPLANAALDAQRAERVRQLQMLFAEWTEEDGRLTDEEADCLRRALEQHGGLGFRSPALD
jgi:hypothetical protein